jgi:hypothetical protein
MVGLEDVENSNEILVGCYPLFMLSVLQRALCY